MAGSQSHYKVNVSKDGKHFFATATRSIVEDTKLTMVFKELITRFPESEGFKVTVTYWSCSGQSVEI